MQTAERNPLTDSVLGEAVTTRVAAAMARKVATDEGFAEGIAFTLTSSIETDPLARRSLMTSALSSAVLKEALLRKLMRELKQPPN